MKSTPESVTRTLRVDRDLDRAIASTAEKQRVSVNFLVNKCIRRYIEWDAPSQEFGIVVIPKLLLDELAKKVDAETFERLGRQVARDYVMPAATYLMGEFSVSSVIEVLRRGAVYGGSFRFDVDEGRDSRHRVIVLRHDQGRLWSRYFAGLLEESFRVLLGEETKVICTDSLCVVQMKAH